MSDIIPIIKSRGYWQVIIRPVKFEDKKVPDFPTLTSTLQSCIVKIRGWDFPQISPKTSIIRTDEYISQELSWEHTREYFRLYFSGQFYFLFAIRYDWRDQSTIWPSDKDWKPGSVIGIGEILYTLSEIYLFASRLARSQLGDSQIEIGYKLGNIQGRHLVVDDPKKWGFDYARTSGVSTIERTKTISTDILITSVKELVIDSGIEIFQLFSWDTSKEIVAKWLDKILPSSST